MAPRVLISDALSPAAVAIFKDRGLDHIMTGDGGVLDRRIQTRGAVEPHGAIKNHHVPNVDRVEEGAGGSDPDENPRSASSQLLHRD